MSNEGIIRNRRKIEASINNAKRFLEIQREFDSFDNYIWSFVGGVPISNYIKTIKDIPAKTELSDIVSSDLKKEALSFGVYNYIFTSTSCRNSK